MSVLVLGKIRSLAILMKWGVFGVVGVVLALGLFSCALRTNDDSTHRPGRECAATFSNEKNGKSIWLLFELGSRPAIYFPAHASFLGRVGESIGINLPLEQRAFVRNGQNWRWGDGGDFYIQLGSGFSPLLLATGTIALNGDSEIATIQIDKVSDDSGVQVDFDKRINGKFHLGFMNYESEVNKGENKGNKGDTPP